MLIGVITSAATGIAALPVISILLCC